ncbi:MAG: PRC and DUF2382 domain-containing protein [Phormidesmis sp.]
MPLSRISDRYPNYRNIYFDGGDLKGASVFSEDSQMVGRVHDLLIDETDRIKYLVVDLDQSKYVLLPMLSCSKEANTGSLYARDLSREDIYQLPAYGDSSGPKAAVASGASRPMMPLESSVPVELTVPVNSVASRASGSLSSTTHTATVSESASDGHSVSLYEERLSTQKSRVKTGEVRISKRVVTETAETNTPVKKEKIVIEIESIYGGDTRIDVDQAEVAEDGSVSMAIYEERAEVCRQVTPYQNVSIRKQVVDDVVTTQETLRREELDINPDGLPYVDWIENPSAKH